MKTSEKQFLKTLMIAVGAGALLAIWAVVNEQSYQDELTEQSTYCDMVGAGAWGDYDKSIPCPWRGQS